MHQEQNKHQTQNVVPIVSHMTYHMLVFTPIGSHRLAAHLHIVTFVNGHTYSSVLPERIANE